MLEPLDSADIFEILGVKERENVYTSLLGYLLKASPSLCERLLQHAFRKPTPPAGSFMIDRQAGLDAHSTPDLLLETASDAGERWVLFVEAKVHSGEHGEQTARYFAACEKRTGESARVGGVFLTLTGDDALHPKVHSLTHRTLADWIAERAADFAEYPVLKAAAEAYVARARSPLPVAADNMPVKALLKLEEGLIPRLAGADALAVACTTGLPGSWDAWSVWIQGRGHAGIGLLFRQKGWLGSAKLGNRWTPQNFNLHLEVNLADGPLWRVKLHFETEPYLPKKKLVEVEDHQRFTEMRDSFRSLLASQLDGSSGWTAKGRELQVAIYKLSVGPDATVSQLRAALAPALEYIAPLVSSALAKAKPGRKT